MVYTKYLGFAWDDSKAESNLAKHGVSFEEATDVFSDLKAIDQEDWIHSTTEHRRRVMGRTRRCVLVVIYTRRQDTVRLISARRASRRERNLYAEAQDSKDRF